MAATIFTDGFDKYGPTGQTTPAAATLLGQVWNSLSGAYSIVAGLSSTGYAVRSIATTTQTMAKTLPTTFTRLSGGVRFQVDSIANVALVALANGATLASYIRLNVTSGTLSLFNGANLLLGTSALSISANITHYLSWDITIGASSAFTVYLDGVSAITGTGNTGNSQASVNAVQLCPQQNGVNYIFDDFFVTDPTDPTYISSVLTNSPRIETRYPSGDSQTQFTNVGAILGTAYSATASTNAPGANQIFLRKFTAQVAQTINSVSCVPQTTSASVKTKAVIYSDSAGTPNALLSSGTEVIGTTTGVTFTGNLVTPQALSAGTAYWIGYITDTSIALQQTDAGVTGQKAANTYASGAPGTAPVMTSGQVSWNLWGNCTGAVVNWEAVDLDPASGDISSISSSTVSNEDLYSFPALSTSPATIYNIGVKGHVKKSDTGARTVDMRLKSTNDSAGSQSGFSPATSYTWVESYFDTNPNGNIAWATAAANAATAGPKVAS